MLLTRAGQKKMNQRRKEYLAEATRLIIEEDNSEAADKVLHKLKQSQELKSEYALLSKQRFISPLLVLACGIIVSFLWIFPYPSSRVHLDLATETAVLRLAQGKDFSWRSISGLHLDSLLADGYFTVEASGLGIGQSAARLLLNGTNLSLTQLSIDKGARLEIERSKDGISLYIYEAGVQGELELRDCTIRLQSNNKRESQTVHSPVPESLRFSTADSNRHRLHLRLKTSYDWQLYGLQVVEMSFRQEVPPDSNNFISSIRKGTIELPEINKRKETLLEHDWLHLNKANSTRLLLHFPANESENFKLMFQGSAAALRAGPDGFEQDLTPSLLNWIYHQKQLAFYWGALVFVYSLLTNLRNLFTRK